MRTHFLAIVISIIILLPNQFLSAQETTTESLLKLIEGLRQQVLLLQKQVTELRSELGAPPTDTSVPSAPTSSATSQTALPVAPAVETLQAAPVLPEFERTLRLGASGDDVRKLQTFLKQFPDIYPQGLVTGYFGPLTRRAVEKFQEKHEIARSGAGETTGFGVLGPQTRSKLNELLTEGARRSGVTPPGLLHAPGLYRDNELSTTTHAISGTIATTTQTIETQTVPATSAVPATPATPSPGGGTAATPATSAQPAIPAQPAISATTTPDTIPPSTPTGLSATAVSATQINLSWSASTDATGVTGYRIYRAGTQSTTVTSGTSYSDAGLTAATSYSYTVAAYDAVANESVQSSSVSATTLSITTPTTAPSASPIGYWKFDGNGNNEIVGNPNAVTVGNATPKTSGGKFGGYLYMPSSADYAKIPYNSMFDLQNFTIEFWFRQRSDQSFAQNLVYKGNPINNYNFRVFRQLWNQNNFGPIIVGYTAANTGYWSQSSNPNQLSHGSWHHVVYTRNANEAAYYLDGILTHSLNLIQYPEYSGPVKTPAVDIIIGNPAPDTDIDNVRIYNYALTRGEVLYNWENIPTVTTTADTTAPSIPTGLTATAVSSTQINVSWTASTDNVGVTGYYIYRNGSQNPLASIIASANTPPYTYNDTGLLSGNISGLSPGTTYTYTVAAYDATGNVSSQSSSVSAITMSQPLLPAPTYIRADWYTSWWDYRDNKVGQQIIFQYPNDMNSKTTKFRFYQKRPADASFSLVGEYSGFDSTSCTANGTRVYVGDWGLIGAPWTSCGTWAVTRNSVPASSYTVGEYSYYITSVDSTGTESPHSTTAKQIFFEPVTILAPIESQSPVSPTPTFQWNVGSGWPPNVAGKAPLLFTIAIFDSLTASNPFWTTNVDGVSSPGINSKVYSGPALDSSKTYRLTIHGWGSQSSQSLPEPSYMALPSAVADFRIASTSAAITDNNNLASVLNSLKDTLERLLRSF